MLIAICQRSGRAISDGYSINIARATHSKPTYCGKEGTLGNGDLFVEAKDLQPEEKKVV